MVRLTLSRLRTCSSVCEDSMICGGKAAECQHSGGGGAAARRGHRDEKQGGGAPYLGVGRLRLLDGLVVLVARRDLAREVVVDARKPLRQDPQVILDLRLLLLILGNRPVDLLALLAQVLNAFDELVVVVLQRSTLLRHGGLSAGGGAERGARAQERGQQGVRAVTRAEELRQSSWRRRRRGSARGAAAASATRARVRRKTASCRARTRVERASVRRRAPTRAQRRERRGSPPWRTIFCRKAGKGLFLTLRVEE